MGGRGEMNGVRFNVAQLLREGVGARRSYTVEAESGFIDALNRQRPVVGRVDMLRTPSGILVRVRISIQIEAQCSRCLEYFHQELTLKIEEEFFPTTDIHSGAALPEPPDGATFLIEENHDLDLTEAVRQYTLLAEPMKPVCRPDCRGLCPSCGRNRNLEPCPCPAEPVDLRWAALTDLTRQAKAS